MTPQMKGALVAVLVTAPMTAAMAATIGPEALLPAVAVLVAAQRASAIKRRKEVWEAMHPNSGTSDSTIQRGPGRPETATSCRGLPEKVWEAMHPNSGATCADIPESGRNPPSSGGRDESGKFSEGSR